MNPFASRLQKTVEIPFDPPNTVTIQRLPGRHLQRAMLENQFASVERFRKMGGAAFQKELDAITDKTAREQSAARVAADPLGAYDPYVLMRFGIVSWTYPEKIEVKTLADGTETVPVLDDLLDEAVEFFAREVLKLSKPALFQTEAEAEAEQKNA